VFVTGWLHLRVKHRGALLAAVQEPDDAVGDGSNEHEGSNRQTEVTSKTEVDEGEAVEDWCNKVREELSQCLVVEGQKGVVVEEESGQGTKMLGTTYKR